MSYNYRKLRVILNNKHPHHSRVVDVETGDDILASDVQITIGHRTKFTTKVQITLDGPGVEIVTVNEDEQETEQAEPESPFIGRHNN